MDEFINVADQEDPENPGMTYREANLKKNHKLILDELVEIEGGVRLRVSKLTRDCDGTPLYCLSAYSRSELDENPNIKFFDHCVNGMPEETLKKPTNNTRTLLRKIRDEISAWGYEDAGRLSEETWDELNDAVD